MQAGDVYSLTVGQFPIALNAGCTPDGINLNNGKGGDALNGQSAPGGQCSAIYKLIPAQNVYQLLACAGGGGGGGGGGPSNLGGNGGVILPSTSHSPIAVSGSAGAGGLISTTGTSETSQMNTLLYVGPSVFFCKRLERWWCWR